METSKLGADAPKEELNKEVQIGFGLDEIKLTISPNECVNDSFMFHTGDEEAEGYVVVNDTRMWCDCRRFSGKDVKISYHFDGKGLENGDVIHGAFYAMTSAGEYELPYSVTVSQEVYETSLGRMKNLFHFTNLAKTNWEEAVKFFYSPYFVNLLTGNDRQYYHLYRGLIAGEKSEQRIEEFLISIKKKQPVEYFLETKEVEITYSSSVGEEYITISKNGWGYTNLHISIDGKFLVLQKDQLTDDDFLGNNCKLAFSVIPQLLHEGRNFGQITFFNEYVKFDVPVCVTVPNKQHSKRNRNIKIENAYMAREYVRYGLKKISKHEWISEAKVSLASTKASSLEENLSDKLLEALVLITEERINEAKWILDHMERKNIYSDEHPIFWCGYLYLMILCSENSEFIHESILEIDHIFANHPTNWRLASLMLFLDGEYDRSPTKKWIFLEEQFTRGCNSPIWYMEAALLLRKTPSLLTKPTPFAIFSLNFIVKYDCLTDEIAERIYYLAGRMREYSPRMCDILERCYRMRGDKDALSALCAMLIKGGKIGPKYLTWYREAILQEIWLTKVYENYVLSLRFDDPEEIPDAVLRYFAYHSELPYDRIAFLYAYVLRNKDRFIDLYRTYMPDLERFTAIQLEQGHINLDLAYLYQKLVHPDFLVGEKADIYARMLAMHEIVIEDKRVTSVIVLHGKLKKEKEYPVTDGVCYAEIYSRDVVLFFRLQNGCRLYDSVPYKCHKLILFHEDVEDISPLISGSSEQLLNLCENGKNYTSITKDNISFVCRILEGDAIEDSYRSELSLGLLHYYMEHDAVRELDDFIPILNPATMNSRERADIIEIMSGRGQFEQAFEWITDYGLENVSPKTLVRIASRMALRIDFTENMILTGIICKAFERGKYDDNVLYYLNRFYRSSISKMTEVWEACERFDVDNYELSERLLRCMAYCGHYCQLEKDIFARYMLGGAKEAVATAYLKHCGREYFRNTGIWDDGISREVARMFGLGEPIPPICMLAALKEASGRSEYTDEEKEMYVFFLHTLIGRNHLFFEFFKHYAELCPDIHAFHDRTMVEFIYPTKAPVVFHYMLCKDGNEEGQYQTEELHEQEMGVFCKEFVLFFGETLHYYFTELVGGKEKLLSSGVLSKSDTGRFCAGSRFNLTNEFAMACEMGSSEVMDNLYEEYYRKDYLVQQLFKFE